MQQLPRGHGPHFAGSGQHRGETHAAARGPPRGAERERRLSTPPLSVADACAAVLRDIAPLETEVVPLAAALGSVLAEEVRSPLALPPWDNASMDGYATRAADIGGATLENPVMLRVVGTVAAGTSSAHELKAGEALRIMTGAPVPAGADTVVRVEDTDGGTAAVRVTNDRDALRNIRARGEDVGRDEVVVATGTRLCPAHLGLLASVGHADARVYRRPRVAVLASGDELVDVDRFDEVLAGSKIVSSNSHALLAAIVEAGGAPVSLGVVGDDPVALRDRLLGCDADMLITTGGVSVGAFDYTRQVLLELGATMRFWRVRIRPGAPVGFGVLRGTPWLGLPGNPVSTLVTFELFARPAIRRMQGLADVYRRPVRVRVSEAITIAAPLTHFLRAIVMPTTDGYVARLTGPQGSGLLTSMARANALLVIPPERARVEAGESVDALIIREDLLHSTEPPGL